MGGWPFRPAKRGRRGRALVAALLVANQFIVTSGWPLPVSAATQKKDLSKPFPCMNSACGCSNADQCWHGCCCFSMREKLAWAKAHGVEPPDFVREAAAEEERADAKNTTLHAALCGKKCCCCCCKQSSLRSDSPVQPKQTDESVPPGGKSIILLMAMQCHGQSVLSILAQALPAIVPAVSKYDFLPIGNVAAIEPALRSVNISPAVPPPKIFSTARLSCA